ncbi:MAG: hypothetical protein HOU01_19605, partial [Streptomycetaceae bacterium]|nr:hypothetical protein [Streptomycetaceae bacterium]
MPAFETDPAPYAADYLAPDARSASRPDTEAEPEAALAAEQAHLAASRAALRRMREETEALDLRDVGGNDVSNKLVHSLIQARIAALADHAHAPLFFGRVDGRFADAPDVSTGTAPVEVAADPTRPVER